MQNTVTACTNNRVLSAIGSGADNFLSFDDDDAYDINGIDWIRHFIHTAVSWYFIVKHNSSPEWKKNKRQLPSRAPCTTKNVLNKLTDIRIPAAPIVLATMDEEKIGNGLTSHDNRHRFHFFSLFFYFQKPKTERGPLLSCDGKRKIVTMIYKRRQMRKTDERAQIIT